MKDKEGLESGEPGGLEPGGDRAGGEADAADNLDRQPAFGGGDEVGRPAESQDGPPLEAQPPEGQVAAGEAGERDSSDRPGEGDQSTDARRQPDIAVHPDSQLSAEQLVALIRGCDDVPQYVQDAISVSPDNPNAIRISAIDDRAVPQGEDASWFNAVISAAQSGEWQITTGNVTNWASGDDAVSRLEPHIGDPAEKPGIRDPQGDWLPDHLATANIGPETAGVVVATEQMAREMNADSPQHDRYNGPTVQGDRGLVVIGNRYEGDILTRDRTPSEIANTFFHELGAHAGRISAGTPSWESHPDVQACIRAIDQAVPPRMPSSQ